MSRRPPPVIAEEEAEPLAAVEDDEDEDADDAEDIPEIDATWMTTSVQSSCVIEIDDRTQYQFARSSIGVAELR